ncbi:MAG: peptidylprolyl isomerase, partial [Gammaproteobacteria bacterium]
VGRRRDRSRLRGRVGAARDPTEAARLSRRARDTAMKAALLDVRARDRREQSPDDDVFARAARNYSNCPSGQHGGDLGWLERADCAPEFARELFGHAEVGVLPRLVHSRFGLHVVEVLERSPGDPLPFEQVSEAVALSLRQQSYVTALRQYLSLLAGAADLRGVDLEAADSPLVR